ncbi:hypothetical protein, partial [Alistipes putredinis]|uniref:hypothetical protein n=1 Tax=Alistipes putredinis TaxID=28117 RepID=UPI003AB6C2C4
ACYGFLSLWIRNTKVSENADMAKTWATKCCPGTYKNNYQLCCGIKVNNFCPGDRFERSGKRRRMDFFNRCETIGYGVLP